MTERHIVKAYDDELARLDQLIEEMGGLVEEQLSAALDALVRHDPEAAKSVIEKDKKVDEYEGEIDHHAVGMLALRQPMAADLRIIVAGLQMASNLERMGDYAKNIAKRTVTLARVPLLAPATRSLHAMGEIVEGMIRDVLNAYTARDVKLAQSVIEQDRNVDRMHNNLFREFLAKMSEEPEHVSAGTHLIFIAKDVERIGDHATNVAEKIYFMLEGVWPPGYRPKEDKTASLIVGGEGQEPAK